MSTAGSGRPRWASWGLPAVGVGAASTASILTRYAVEADALAISLWRCGGGAAALLPFAGRALARRRPRAMAPSAVAGILLAAHFAAWITALKTTTVAAAVLLVSTAPAFVALGAPVVLRERLPTLGWVGIALAVAGAGAIGAGVEGGDVSTFGNVLALVGAAGGAGYILAGRAARRSSGIAEHAGVAYGVAAATLALAVAATGTPVTGFGPRTWWALAGLIAGPQLFGHTIINLVLDELDATTVSVAVMAEPVVATALAWTLFAEVPPALVYPAGAAILAGMYLASTTRRSPAVTVG